VRGIVSVCEGIQPVFVWDRCSAGRGGRRRGAAGVLYRGPTGYGGAGGTGAGAVAISNSGYKFPSKKVIVNLAPASLRKKGRLLIYR
jgi:hypothetical protein